MKLLIIAGPYEADRIRRAAVPAGFETVAVEPGESLSGWISASRPDIIVMAPKIVNADPSVALSKVRAVPRGRVPIILVGDVDDEIRLKGLADGFFVRPISPGDLISQARSLLARDRDPAAPVDGSGSGPKVSGDGREELSRPTPTPKTGPHGVKGGPPSLKPLVAQSEPQPVPPTPARARKSADFLVHLAESIDATLDAEMNDVMRMMGAVEGSPDAAPVDAPPDEAEGELDDESSQKTLEVPQDLVARMATDRSKDGPGAGAATTRFKAGSETTTVGHRALAPAGDLDVPAPVEAGQLAEHDLPSLLGRISTERLTGWLTLRRDGVEKAIVFDRGNPILAGSNQPEDRMGEMLVRQGRLSMEQQARSAAILVNTGQRLGEVLVEMGLIKASELGPLVRRHYEEIIYSVFAWESGEWLLAPDRPEKEETVLLTEHAPALILEGIRRKYTAGRLLAHIGGADQVLRLPAVAGTSELLERMGLTDEERTLVPLFDGVRALGDVRNLTDAPEESLYGLVWALLVLGQLERVERASQEAAAPVDSSGDPGASRHDRERDRDRRIDRARVMARYALVQDGDYFQILGVARDATAHEIRRAHQALCRELAPQSLEPSLVSELSSELQAIRVVLDEGIRILADPRIRPRYQSRLPAFSPFGRRSEP
jgi:hypothetical protein